jgi:hypothetical protein
MKGEVKQVKGRKHRRRGVQLDLFSPVDDSGNLLTCSDGTAQLHFGLLPDTALRVLDGADSGVMCGESVLSNREALGSGIKGGLQFSGL